VRLYTNKKRSVRSNFRPCLCLNDLDDFNKNETAGCGGGWRDAVFHVGQTDPDTESRKKLPIGYRGLPIGVDTKGGLDSSVASPI
jgi:hypothetical protein